MLMLHEYNNMGMTYGEFHHHWCALWLIGSFKMGTFRTLNIHPAIECPSRLPMDISQSLTYLQHVILIKMICDVHVYVYESYLLGSSMFTLDTTIISSEHKYELYVK